MFRVVLLTGILGTLIGGGYLVYNYRLDTQVGDDGKVSGVRLARRSDGQGFDVQLPWSGASQPAARPVRPNFRIASYHIPHLDERKLANRRLLDVLVRVIPQFEVVAIQGFEGNGRSAVLRLVEHLNSAGGGRAYDFAVAPPSGRPGCYTAILFDQTAIEIDRTTVRTVDGGRSLFREPPLAALFRVRGPKPSEAFTFQLISVSVDPDRASAELDLLADVYRAVRDDGRGEDDVILIGDLASDETHLGQLGALFDIATAIHSLPTNVRGTRRTANALFTRRATVEFTGRAGVVDLMRQCDLTIEQAAEVSENLPIWIELSSFEGGHPGVAER